MKTKQSKFESPFIRNLVVTDNPICLTAPKKMMYSTKSTRKKLFPRFRWFRIADVCCVCVCDFPCVCPGDCSCPCGNVSMPMNHEAMRGSTPDKAAYAVRLKRTVKVRKEDFGGLVGDISSHGVYVTNDSGYVILSQLKKQQVPADLARLVTESYDIGPTVALPEIRSFLDTLSELGITEIVESLDE